MTTQPRCAECGHKLTTYQRRQGNRYCSQRCATAVDVRLARQAERILATAGPTTRAVLTPPAGVRKADWLLRQLGSDQAGHDTPGRFSK